MNDEENKTAEEEEQKKRTLSPIVTFRLLLFAAAALFAVTIKLLGGAAYERVRELYIEYSHDSVIADVNKSNSDFIRSAQNDFKDM